MSTALVRVFGSAMSGKCDKKQDLADSLITGDAAITKRLTEEDIKYIFGK